MNLVDQSGYELDIRSYQYASDYLKHIGVLNKYPKPEAKFYYRGERCKIVPLTEPGLWLPLSCAIARVPFTTTSNGSHDTNTVTVGSIDTTGANFGVVTCCDYALATAPMSFADNKGNPTYSALTAYTYTSGAIRHQIFYIANAITGVNHTVTGTGIAGYPSASMIWYSGVDTTPFDVENGSTGSTGTTTQPGNVTPGQTGELIVTGIGWTIAVAPNFPTIDSSFIVQTNVDYSAGNNFGSELADLIETSIVSKNPTWTFNASRDNITSIATFKPGGAVTKISNLAIQGVG